MMKRILSLVLLLMFVTACGMAVAESQKVYRYSDYRYVILPDETAEIVGYEGHSTRITIASWLNGTIKVTSIGENAFIGYEAAKEITIPDTVTNIGDYAFKNCNGLESITIPDTVLTIGKNPFLNCELLTDIQVSDDHPTLATIDGVLFEKSSKRLVCYPRTFAATSYSIPQGIKVIGADAFTLNKALTAVEIPDSVKEIGDCAFSSSGLTTVSLPESVETIGVNPFRYCNKLVGIMVPQTHPWLATIDGVLFSKADKRLVCYPCTYKQTGYEIPRGIRIIGDGAFWWADSLEEIVIPDTVTAIGESAFLFCKGLETVTLPDSVTTIGESAFSSCSGLTDIVLPSGLTVLEPNMFSTCWDLKNVTLPQGLKEIKHSAFSSCSALESIVLPEGLAAIGNRAFAGCRALKELTLPASLTDISTSAFDGCDALEKVHVSGGTYAAQWAKANDMPCTSSDNLDWLMD